MTTITCRGQLKIILLKRCEKYCKVERTEGSGFHSQLPTGLVFETWAEAQQNTCNQLRGLIREREQKLMEATEALNRLLHAKEPSEGPTL